MTVTAPQKNIKLLNKDYEKPLGNFVRKMTSPKKNITCLESHFIIDIPVYDCLGWNKEFGYKTTVPGFLWSAYYFWKVPQVVLSECFPF